jgi:hypothetical protein
MLRRAGLVSKAFLRNVPSNTTSRRFASTKVLTPNIFHLSHANIRTQTLKETLQDVIPAKQEQLKRLVRADHSVSLDLGLIVSNRKLSMVKQSSAMSRLVFTVNLSTLNTESPFRLKTSLVVCEG